MNKIKGIFAMMAVGLFLVMIAPSFVMAQVADTEVDPCAAYQSQEGYDRCHDRLMKFDRMKAAKGNRIQADKEYKARLKSRGIRGKGMPLEDAMIATGAMPDPNAPKEEGADTATGTGGPAAKKEEAVTNAGGMSAEEVQKEVERLRQELKQVQEAQDQKAQVKTSPKTQPPMAPEMGENAPLLEGDMQDIPPEWLE